MFSDVASAPGLPEIVDYDENMVELKWDPPIRDGGAPITGKFSYLFVLTLFYDFKKKILNYYKLNFKYM